MPEYCAVLALRISNLNSIISSAVLLVGKHSVIFLDGNILSGTGLREELIYVCVAVLPQPFVLRVGNLTGGLY